MHAVDRNGDQDGRMNLSPIIIGTTGHRVLDNDDRLHRSIMTSVKKILEMNEGGTVTVLSPLAEGADRLLYESIKEMHPETGLHAIIPMDVCDYLKDFGTDASKEQFLEMLEDSISIDVVLAGSQTKKTERYEGSSRISQMIRNASYDACGKLMVDICDILIAIWDGEEARGKGGTGDVVQYARNRATPLIWISSKEPYGIIYERIPWKNDITAPKNTPSIL